MLAGHSRCTFDLIIKPSLIKLLVRYVFLLQVIHADNIEVLVETLHPTELRRYLSPEIVGFPRRDHMLVLHRSHDDKLQLQGYIGKPF
jgi:hypothetical protein